MTASDVSVDKPLRRIRSFVLRTGRLTDGQQKALDQHWHSKGLGVSNGPLDIAVAFGRAAPTVLEIGFGSGDSLLAMAAAAPERNFIGVEVHTPGVGHLLHGMAQQGVDNIRVYREDAVDVLTCCIANDALAGVQIFFPDPWHKKKHHKRRLIQPAFISLLCEKISAGGTLHLATDWQHYAEQMLDVLSAESRLRNTAGAHQFAPRPASRPQTKFERRGERLGHGVWDLVFVRC